MGIASRKHSLEVLDDDHKQTLLQNKVVVSQLERLARQETYHLNTIVFLREEVFTRIHIGINRWCESKDVLIVIQEIQCKMTNLLSEIQFIIHNIEKDITGFARSIHDVSLSVFTRQELRRTLLNNGLALIEMITIPFLDDIQLVQRMIEKRAKTIYDRWLSTFSNTHIQRSFEENFGTEYDKQKCQRYETDNNRLRKQVKLLQVELHATKEENKVLNEKFNNTDELLKDKLVEKLTKSNSNVKCFLGLPSISMLFGIFKLLEGHASKMKYWMGPDSSDGKRWQVNNKKKPGASRKLTFFEEFVITLLRLRLGLNTYVLSLLFGVSQSTISRVFTTWISLMAQCLGPLIKWPSKEKIKKHMPLSFRRKYPNTRVIIDATEFYVQRPRNPTAQSKTWSNYKSKNTFKTLVGITPNGAFSFISDLWTGNISDRSITERSGFIDLIEKGDHVMADRGFLIKDLLLSKGATLNMPPFTRPCKHGKGRCLTAKEIKESKSIASLRIHVERSIQRLKSYKFLSGVMPINSLSVANQALKVAGFFCNLMKPLVQKL
ncbi:unnamed protein product [Mytilus edulis]|uniref:DDE Tnp4 domain-containing protein n=1 Tax=Mytilus edulis TaxID=6550 RepID=A0A8S3TJ08_MYTED|nr:unnamed protein product [Mytilus edulis]